MKIVYKKTGWKATDIRRERDDYVLQQGEFELPDADELPSSGGLSESPPARDYRDLRLEAYRERGATETACVEAIIEYLAGHTEKMQQLAVIRDSVKQDIPKEP